MGIATARELVTRLGGHPARDLGLDLVDGADAGAWLIAACLLCGSAKPEVAGNAYRSLAAHGLAEPEALAVADPVKVAWRLADAAYPKPEVAAQRLCRASAALVSRWEGSPRRMAADADGLDDLGGRITSLAPGVGRATALVFLRPLREVFAAAGDLPLAPSALAAAVHLGWLAPGADETGEPSVLRALLASEPDPPALADVEAALERLGSRACLRERPERCPLRGDCPLRASGVASAGGRE